MSNDSKLPVDHWTDERLIDHVYGLHPDDVEPEDNHLLNCLECRNRQSAMVARRASLEEVRSPADDVSFECLARQRREIYARIENPANRWSTWHVRRWASAAAATLAIGGGLFLLENDLPHGTSPEQSQRSEQKAVSDSDLAAQVSQIADSSEPESTGPLQALFE